MGRFLSALTRHRATTEPHHSDPGLRGRTYGVPFRDVWAAAVDLASGGLSRWSLTDRNDSGGRITAEARTLGLGTAGDVEIRIGLDENGQTRVDLRSISRGRKIDLGANRRRIVRFQNALDRSLGAGRIAGTSVPTSPRGHFAGDAES